MQGKVPTTPTSASIVAAFQTQEALKLLHNMEVLPGKALMINGLTNDIYLTEYPIKAGCMSHSWLRPIVAAGDTAEGDAGRPADHNRRTAGAGGGAGVRQRARGLDGLRLMRPERTGLPADGPPL